MKTKLLIFAILIAMLFSACEQPPVQSTAPSAAELTDPPYKVYLSGGTENGQLFTADAETFSATEKKSFSNVPNQIMLMLPARGTYLNYYSTGVNAHQYRSEDDSVRCQLNINTGALSFLTVTDFSFLSDFVCKDEASFEASAKELISLYYPGEDWSKYTVHCSTSKILFSEDYTEAKSFDGFLTAENQNEQISGYTLVFSRIIDGLPVDDYIEVRLSEVALMVRFSPHKFDTIDSIALNMEHLNASIDAFLNAGLDKSKYTLQDYTLSAPTIVRIGDQLYYSAHATLEVQPVNGATGNLTYTVPLITDIEVNVSDAGISAPVKPYRIVTEESATPTQPATAPTTPDLPAEYLYAQNEEYEAFIYNGAQPEFAAEAPIDTSGLVQGTLYLYNKTEKQNIAVTNQPINGNTAFLLTDERIYFVLASDPKTICQSDLTGQILEPFCTDCPGESIVYLCYYGTNATDGRMFFNDNYKMLRAYQKDKGFGHKASAEQLRLEMFGNMYLGYLQEQDAVLLYVERENGLVAQTGTTVFWD